MHLHSIKRKRLISEKLFIFKISDSFLVRYFMIHPMGDQGKGRAGAGLKKC